MNTYHNNIPVRVLAANAPVDPGFLPRGWANLDDPVLVTAHTGFPFWVPRASLVIL